MVDNNEMCKNCYPLRKNFGKQSWKQTYELMKKMYYDKKLNLYMADCSLDHFLEEISSESHYTYNIYLECTNCGIVYHLGICIRSSSPLFKIYETKPSKEKFRYICIRDNRNYFDSTNIKDSRSF